MAVRGRGGARWVQRGKVWDPCGVCAGSMRHHGAPVRPMWDPCMCGTRVGPAWDLGGSWVSVWNPYRIHVVPVWYLCGTNLGSGWDVRVCQGALH